MLPVPVNGLETVLARRLHQVLHSTLRMLLRLDIRQAREVSRDVHASWIDHAVLIVVIASDVHLRVEILLYEHIVVAKLGGLLRLIEVIVRIELVLLRMGLIAHVRVKVGHVWLLVVRHEVLLGMLRSLPADPKLHREALTHLIVVFHLVLFELVVVHLLLAVLSGAFLFISILAHPIIITVVAAVIAIIVYVVRLRVCRGTCHHIVPLELQLAAIVALGQHFRLVFGYLHVVFVVFAIILAIILLLILIVIAASIRVEFIVTVLVVHLAGIHIAVVLLVLLILLRLVLLILELACAASVLLVQAFLGVAVEAVLVRIEPAILIVLLVWILLRVQVPHLVHLVLAHTTAMLALRVADLSLTSLADVHALIVTL